MFDHILKVAFPKVGMPLFALRVRQLNLTRLELDGILICFAGVALGILLGFFYPRFSWDYSSYDNILSILIFGAFILSGNAIWITSDISVLEFGGIILLGVVIWAVIRGSHRLLTKRALKALTRRLERIEPN